MELMAFEDDLNGMKTVREVRYSTNTGFRRKRNNKVALGQLGRIQLTTALGKPLIVNQTRLGTTFVIPKWYGEIPKGKFEMILSLLMGMESQDPVGRSLKEKVLAERLPLLALTPRRILT